LNHQKFKIGHIQAIFRKNTLPPSVLQVAVRDMMKVESLRSVPNDVFDSNEVQQVLYENGVKARK